MFGNGGAGIWGGLSPQTDDILKKARAPPPKPLPLDFPKYVPECKPRPLDRHRMAALRRSVLSLRRPNDNNEAVMTLLNLHLTPDVPLQDFLPANFLPQRPYPYDADLEAMLAELQVENEDAFREVLRQTPKEGRTKPRIAYSRNFYGNLEDISRYMDATDDNYFDASDAETDTDGDSQMSGTAPASQKKTKPMYKGHRLGNAAQVPPATRVGAARNLLKMVVHKFECRDYDISPKERLRIKDINLPPGLTMYSFTVGKIPVDRTLARARNVEGPVLGVSVRHECIFDDEVYGDLLVTRGKNEIGDCLGSQVDLLRETGSALVIALQRHREGRKKPSEHERITSQWWWAQKPRWGGGQTKWGMLASEVFEDEDPSWSPVERKLQHEKREKTQAEMKRIDEVTREGGASKPGDGLRVSDLIAKGEEAASLTARGGPDPGIGLLAVKNSVNIPKMTPTENSKENASQASVPGIGQGESDEKPPKKKNRLTVPVTDSPLPQSITSASASSTSPTSSDNNISSPTTNPNASLIPAATSNGNSRNKPPTTSPISPLTNPKFIIRPSKLLADRPSSSTSSASREEKEKEKAPEMRDGRRLMYTAPMRRKWFKEWCNVRPNSSSWDERVIWRRVGAPGVKPAVKDDSTGGNGSGRLDIRDEAGEKMGLDVGVKNGTTPGVKSTAEAGGQKKEQVANNDDEEFDEIYQISCINHHVALLKMRVSRRYLRWLETGHADLDIDIDTDITVTGASTENDADVSASNTAAATATTNPTTSSAAANPELGPTTTTTLPTSKVDPIDTTPSQHQPKAQRSRRQITEADILQLSRSPYYDLFNIAERTEFVRALWRIMSWVMRDEGGIRVELERLQTVGAE